MSTARAKRASNGTAPGYRVHFYCPGCQSVHGIVTDNPSGWGFNGDYERPTFTPSVLVHPHKTFVDSSLDLPALTAPENVTETPLCHSFVTDGRIQFLPDSTHRLAGQTVDLPAWSTREEEM